MDSIRNVTMTAQLPEEIQNAALASLRTPQRGPFHNEGAFMESHLQLMLEVLDDVWRQRFHPAVSLEAALAMHKALVDTTPAALMHVVLHDIDKPSCLTLVFVDDSKDERTGLEGLPLESEEAWDAYCEEQGIVQVSYYHESTGRMHGKVAAERLRALGFDDLLVKGIETHEIAMAFGDRGGVNIPLFEEHFGGMNEREIGYVLLVNYLDQMASLGPDGQPCLDDFVWLMKSWRGSRSLKQVKHWMATHDRLDQHKLNQILAKLRNDKDAFTTESFVDAYARILKEVVLPEVTADQVREALTPAIAEGLSSELVEAIVSEMTSDGKVSSDTGKKIGKFNKLVRPALAKLGK